MANKDTDGIKELYAANIDDSKVIQLSSPQSVNFSITSYQVSADRKYVTYLITEQQNFLVSQLYVVNVNGGNPIRVSGDLAYRTNLANPKLYTVRSSGLNNVVISGGFLVNGSIYEDYRWSPDSSRIAYRADQDVDEQLELYAGQADGSGDIKLSRQLVEDGDVLSYELVD